MTDVDDAIERAENGKDHWAVEFPASYEARREVVVRLYADRELLAAEVRRLRQVIADDTAWEENARLREQKHVLIQTLGRVEAERDGLQRELAQCRKGITRWPADRRTTARTCG